MKNRIIDFMSLLILFVSFSIISPVYGDLQNNTNEVFSYDPLFLLYVEETNGTPSLSLPIYTGVIRDGDSLIIENSSLMLPKDNVTSAQEAPIIAEQILTQNGGLPPDAEMGNSYTNYLKKIQSSTGRVLESSPTDTSVFYHRRINTVPVVGQNDKIVVSMGNEGELLYLFKIWRTLEATGSNASIIPISNAIEKLQRGELIRSTNGVGNITIENATLCYYEKSRTEPSIIIEPVWVFYGNSTSGDPAVFAVYARKFANFTATPAEVTKWQAVQFNDTSDASPTRWYWEFGDGTNSTEQNPAHLYKDGGNYTVNLTVWNDLGSDTISRENYVHVYYYGLPPIAGFTSNCTVTTNPFYPVSSATIQFYDQSNVTGNNTRWFWDFSDGTNSTEQNPVHTLTFPDVPGEDTFNTNYRVTLNVIDEFGRTATTYRNYHVFKDFHMNFIGVPYSGPTPLEVNFTELPDEIPEDYVGQRLWEFGDGSTYEWIAEWDETYTIILNPAPKNITHIYASPGNYSVTLTKQYSEMGSYAITKEHYIVVGGDANAPAVDFTANATWGKEPLAIAFLDQSSRSPNNWTWNFGDKTNSTDQNPTHVYTEAGTYTVSLTAANNDGSNTTVKQDYIHVLPVEPPVADFSANVTSGYPPLPVAFSDMSANVPVNWTWDFGDGTNSTEQNPEHTYAAIGNYTVSLFVMNDEGGNSTTKTEYIHIGVELPVIIDDTKAAPISDFTSNTTTGKAPLAVAFNDTSIFYPTNWNWSFGDGVTAIDQNPEYLYTEPGTYTVNLTTGNAHGENLTIKTDYITVLPRTIPVADFTANATSGQVPLAVEFTDASSGSPTSWGWSFGDGGTSGEQNPIHVYTTTGQFTVTLHVTNEDGGNTTTKTEYITVVADVPPPVANFTGKPTCGKAPLLVKFTDASTGDPTSWFWDFGDGTNATERDPVHVYTSGGKYTVSLTAANAGGSGTKTRIDYISISGSVKPPVANFYGKPTSGKAPLSVKFTDTSSGAPTSWYWDFGDNTNATDRNPVHSYDTSGKYTVSLTVTNSAGSNTKTRTQYITVKGSPPPVANFYGKPTSGNEPLSVKFTDTSTGFPTGWSWDFGDGSTSADKNPTHNYPTAGKYTVSLTASNAAGSDSKTRTQYITVKSASPTPTPTHTCTPKPTTACTTKPTTTCTPAQCEPHEIPQVTGTTENGKIRIDWNVIANPCLQGYKVVISKNNPNPKYPDDGYMFWITDRTRNYAVISRTEHYNGSDFGGYLHPGESYYFSVTAVYSDTKVAGNTVLLEYPV
jgi:PKD repeat protein